MALAMELLQKSGDYKPQLLCSCHRNPSGDLEEVMAHPTSGGNDCWGIQTPAVLSALGLTLDFTRGERLK